MLNSRDQPSNRILENDECNSGVSLKHKLSITLKLNFVMRWSRGSLEVWTTLTLNNHKAIGFFRNTVPDPWQFTKLPSKHTMLCNQLPASETTFEMCFTCEPLMTRFYLYTGTEIRMPNKKPSSELDLPYKMFLVGACSWRNISSI